MKKKMLSTLLIAGLVCVLSAGCGKENVPANEGDGQASASAEKSVREDAAKVEASDEITTQNVVDKGVVKLRLIFYGDMTSRRQEYFEEDFHDRVLEDLNIDLTVETLPWGSNDTVGTMLASGEAFAIENIVVNNDWASKGYLAPINQELIDALMPEYITARGETNGFECVKYNDDIYAIPFGNKPYSGNDIGINVRNDILKQYGYEANEITTYEQLMEMLNTLHMEKPELRILRSAGFLHTFFRPVYTEDVVSLISGGKDGINFLYVREDEEGDNVYSWYESEYYAEHCKLAEEWFDLGYISMDEITNPTQGQADWEAGNCLGVYGRPGCYVSTQLKNIDPNAEEKLIVLDGAVKIKTNDYDWGISISATDAENVDRWLTLFNWMYQDQEHYNFCVYGVEGEDWEYNEDGTIHKLCTDSFIDGWFMESIPYNTYDSSIPEENVELYMHWDEGSILAKHAGFVFDTAPVATEAAMLSAVADEYFFPMSLGIANYDENIEEALAELKKAGIDAYLEEYQRQFSEWYAGNH